jgi:hypothetical protein
MADGTAERRAAAKAVPSAARFQNVDVNTCRSLPERRAEGGLCRPQWHPSGDRNPDEQLRVSKHRKIPAISPANMCCPSLQG